MANPERRLQTLLGHLKGGDEDAVVPATVGKFMEASQPSRGNYKYTVDGISEGVLSKEQRDFYEKNGYFVVPGLLWIEGVMYDVVSLLPFVSHTRFGVKGEARLLPGAVQRYLQS